MLPRLQRMVDLALKIANREMYMTMRLRSKQIVLLRNRTMGELANTACFQPEVPTGNPRNFVYTTPDDFGTRPGFTGVRDDSGEYDGWSRDVKDRVVMTGPDWMGAAMTRYYRARLPVDLAASQIPLRDRNGQIYVKGQSKGAKGGGGNVAPATGGKGSGGKGGQGGPKGKDYGKGGGNVAPARSHGPGPKGDGKGKGKKGKDPNPGKGGQYWYGYQQKGGYKGKGKW